MVSDEHDHVRTSLAVLTRNPDQIEAIMSLIRAIPVVGTVINLADACRPAHVMVLVLLAGGMSPSCASGTPAPQAVNSPGDGVAPHTEAHPVAGGGDPFKAPFNGPYKATAMHKEDQASVECDYLMVHLSASELEMLKAHAPFLRVGSAMSPTGEIIDVSAVTGNVPVTEETIVSLLEEDFRRGAKDGRYKATTLVVHMRIPPHGKSQTQDAIGYRQDQRDGFSRVLVFPYFYRANGSLEIETAFTLEGEHRIFPRPAHEDTPAAGDAPEQ